METIIKEKSFKYNYEELNSIHNENKNISMLKREIDCDIIDFLHKLYICKPKEIDISLEINEVKAYLESTYNKYEKLNKIGYDKFLLDIMFNIDIYSKVTNTNKISLYLSFLTKTKCPLFHFDFNELRLLCTYYGKGTEWVTNDNYNKEKLGCGKNDLIIKDSRKINKANEFDILIIKGSKYPNNKYPLVHRSSDVPEKKFRFLLRIDKN